MTTFTPSKQIKLCVGCWELFAISEKRLEQQARYAPELETDEELVGEIEWCLHCITGVEHPEERQHALPHKVTCPNDHVRCLTCGIELCGRGPVDYHRAFGHQLEHHALCATGAPVCI